MKLSKQVLKKIVKECIVEILAEGLGESLNEAVVRQPHTKQEPKQLKNAALLETVKRAAGKDEHLLDVLADTAATSFQTMLSEDRVPQVPPTFHQPNEQPAVQQEFSQEKMNKWQALAFAKPKSKQR